MNEKKEFIIHLTSGKEQQVSKTIAENLNTRILEGCKSFQTYTDENGLFFIVNLQTVTHISKINF